MKTITVTCRKSDPAAIHRQKYDNDEPWNIDGGCAPNGVSATRYLRKISPDVSQLSPLAAWLFEHCPAYVAGYEGVSVQAALTIYETNQGENK